MTSCSDPVQQLRLLLDNGELHQGSSMHIVIFVETVVMVIENVKMAKAGVEAEAGCRSLLAIYNGWMVLYKWNGAKYLLAQDCVHSHSIEIVAADFHVRRSK